MKIIVESQSELVEVPELIEQVDPSINLSFITELLAGVTVTGAAPVVIRKPLMLAGGKIRTGADGKPVVVSIEIQFPAQ